MKTKKMTVKQTTQEKAKIYLFNILYGFRFDVDEFNEDTKQFEWNGITLAEHIENNKEGQIFKSALESIKSEEVYIYALVRRVSANKNESANIFFCY